VTAPNYEVNKQTNTGEQAIATRGRVVYARTAVPALAHGEVNKRIPP